VPYVSFVPPQPRTREEKTITLHEHLSNVRTSMEGVCEEAFELRSICCFTSNIMQAHRVGFLHVASCGHLDTVTTILVGEA
jgi:hypothetical protein